MKYIALLCVFATALTFVGVVPGRAQNPPTSAMQDSGPYVFGKEIYEFTIAPNGNGMIYKFNGNSKSVAALIMGGQISGFGGRDPRDASKAYAEWYAKTHPGATAPVGEMPSGPSAIVTEAPPPTQQPGDTRSGGGNTPANIVWDGAAHTVTANGVRFSGDGMHLQVVDNPAHAYIGISATYVHSAAGRSGALLRGALIGMGGVGRTGATPSVDARWDFFTGTGGNGPLLYSTADHDYGGRTSSPPVPLLQQVDDAARQISEVPAKDIPAWYKPIQGIDKIEKHLKPSQ